VCRSNVTAVVFIMFRRQDDGAGASCHTSTGHAYNPDDYNLGLHVGSLFVVLAVSSLACAFPLLVLRFPRLRIPTGILFVVRHFGTGVLLATAFVHLLPTAFISLGDPCLSGFWTDDYPAMPGAIALLAIFLIAGIEMTFSPEKRCCAAPMTVGTGAVTIPRGTECRTIGEDGRCGSLDERTGNSPAVARPAADSDKSHEHSDAEFDLDAKITLTIEQEHRKAFLQCVLLEVGILFHSVFIGMNLSVSAGREFVILFIAIVFHRKSTSAIEVFGLHSAADFGISRNVRRSCSGCTYCCAEMGV
jgi:zinc transporter 1/2/3